MELLVMAESEEAEKQRKAKIERKEKERQRERERVKLKQEKEVCIGFIAHDSESYEKIISYTKTAGCVKYRGGFCKVSSNSVASQNERLQISLTVQYLSITQLGKPVSSTSIRL
jgi:hypothetical protein